MNQSRSLSSIRESTVEEGVLKKVSAEGHKKGGASGDAANSVRHGYCMDEDCERR